jgi:hypothetical protein
MLLMMTPLTAAPTISWWTVDGGGGTSTGGGYTLQGTIGQAEAHSAAAVGNGLLVRGGFWAAGEMSLTLPVLNISPRPDGQVDISWGLDAVGWHVEISYDLEHWVTEGPISIAVPGSFTNQPGPAVRKKFYRLRQ